MKRKLPTSFVKGSNHSESENESGSEDEDDEEDSTDEFKVRQKPARKKSKNKPTTPTSSANSIVSETAETKEGKAVITDKANKSVAPSSMRSMLAKDDLWLMKNRDYLGDLAKDFLDKMNAQVVTDEKFRKELAFANYQHKHAIQYQDHLNSLSWWRNLPPQWKSSLHFWLSKIEIVRIVEHQSRNVVKRGRTRSKRLEVSYCRDYHGNGDSVPLIDGTNNRGESDDDDESEDDEDEGEGKSKDKNHGAKFEGTTFVDANCKGITIYLGSWYFISAEAIRGFKLKLHYLGKTKKSSTAVTIGWQDAYQKIGAELKSKFEKSLPVDSTSSSGSSNSSSSSDNSWEWAPINVWLSLVYTLVLPCEHLAFASETSGVEIAHGGSSKSATQAFYLPGKLYNHDAYKLELSPLRTLENNETGWYASKSKDSKSFWLLPEDDSEYPESTESTEPAGQDSSLIAALWRLPHSCKNELIRRHLRSQILRFCKLSEDEFQDGMSTCLQERNSESLELYSNGGRMPYQVWFQINPYLVVGTSQNGGFANTYSQYDDDHDDDKKLYAACEIWEKSFKERINELADFLDASFSQLPSKESPLWGNVMLTAATVGTVETIRARTRATSLLEPANVTSYFDNLCKRAEGVKDYANLPICLAEMVSVYERDKFKFHRR